MLKASVALAVRRAVCSNTSGVEKYTLYRNSPFQVLRVHWATFDSVAPDLSYNSDNCEMAARLLNANLAATRKTNEAPGDSDVGSTSLTASLLNLCYIACAESSLFGGSGMRSILVGLLVVLSATSATAQVYVHGYTTKNGTYVAPHYRSAPDGNPYNNWSTVGNVNPYTGQAGTRNPYNGYSNSYGSYQYTPPSCLYCSSNQTQQNSEDTSDPQ
jgi:hypothetical protein